MEGVPEPVSDSLSDRQRLLELLREHSVRRGEFTLASGARATVYVDCRATTCHAEGQVLIGRLMGELLRDAGWRPRSVGGLTMGADPVACAMAHASWGSERPVHAFSVRKEPKAHGTTRRVEGVFSAGDEVVILEDTVTSGGSALRACEAVTAEGGRVLGILALVDRDAGGREAIEAAGYPLRALYSLPELLGEGG
jgi:orotate phosphoribosyltransferase